jgi:hypothetical protein
MISRRLFLKFLGTALTTPAVYKLVPAFSETRKPYVLENDLTVDYVGPAGSGFIGGQSIKSVKPWDGTGYPVETYKNSFKTPRETETYYDFELVNFNRELPDNFWLNPKNKKYNNVHTYIVEKRFGITLAEAIKKLNYVSAS